MTTPTQQPDRCPTCDRPTGLCTRWRNFTRTDVTLLNPTLYEVMECEAHRVDWRAEALGLRERLAAAEALASTGGVVEPDHERIAAWLESVSQGPSLAASHGRTLAAEIRSGAWRGAKP